MVALLGVLLSNQMLYVDTVSASRSTYPAASVSVHVPLEVS